MKKKDNKYFATMAMEAADIVNDGLREIGVTPIVNFQHYEVMRVMRAQLENAYEQGLKDAEWISNNGQR